LNNIFAPDNYKRFCSLLEKDAGPL
jgi:hypothetical protein